MATGDLNTEIDGRVEDLLTSLRRSGATLAVAESCTGGMVMSALTAPAGASDVIWGGAVVYANAAKTALLGVSTDTLGADGPVARTTTRELAENIRRIGQTTFGAAVTGWAGPGHGEEPAGTTYLAVAGPLGTEDAREVFTGDRTAVRVGATIRLVGMVAAAVERASC